MPNVLSTLSTSSSTPSSLGSANFADASMSASSHSSIQSNNSVDSASIYSIASSDGEFRPRTLPSISMEARARIDAYLMEHGREPVYAPHTRVTEDDVREAEAYFLAVDNEIRSITEREGTRRTLSDYASDASSDSSFSFADLPSLVGPSVSSASSASNDDAMSIVSNADIPVNVTHVFVETEQPGVFEIEYRAVRKPGQQLVNGKSNAPAPPPVSNMRRVSIEDITDGESLLSDKTDHDLPPHTTVAESVNEGSYREIMHTLKWLASNPLHV
ncbi:hypothetical protein AURDEDRAFT_165733 [Auricularia subglabra TFB-10046 SS5]|nr:hypothetical protein AURDEDRAFT_165733 [Auricularia subglabra TFB-10046 SS5]